MRQALLDHDPGRPQDAFVLALDLDDPHRPTPDLRDHRLHDESGAEHEAIEPLATDLEIGDRTWLDVYAETTARWLASKHAAHGNKHEELP